MALRTVRLRPGRRRGWHTGGLSLLVALGVVLGGILGGCSPVEAWRSLNGIDRNDPDPQTAPFTQNLAKGEAEPYPNLASVPPLPTRATTTAERQKLTQSLIADRGATAAAAGPDLPRPAAAASAPSPPNGRSFGPAAAATAAPPPRGRTASASPSAQSGPRKADEPPVPQPLESSLQMPQIQSVPQPEAARPAPPPPVLPAVSSPAPAAEPTPAAIASAVPQPAPPVPDMAPIAPPSAPVKAEPKRTPAATTVATLELAAASATPNAEERAKIERVAALYKDKPGSMRVLAYAATPAPGSDPLASYHTALDRAQVVAKALAAAGIPANKIQSEAAPALGARAAGRVEIQFTQ